ncbi:MAG TPA: lipase family protein [Pseudolabrys sp.]|nr:lipase family protein [Pseudolabrys sp.]
MSKFVQLPPQDYDLHAFDKFSATRGHFDLDDARAMMWMAQLSYETDVNALPTIAEIGPKFGFKPIPHFIGTGTAIDTRAIVGERPDCTVVAFAGTDPALADNLVTDAKVEITANDTHKGFQEALDAVWRQIEAAIRTSQRPLFFTGHSLGAALAVLAAEKAHDNNMPPAAVFTYGMPRTGSGIFATRYNGKLGDRTFRLVHGGDIVPCIPEVLVRPAPLATIMAQHVGCMLKCSSGAKFDRNAPLSAMTSDDPRLGAGLRENAFNSFTAMLSGKFLSQAGPGLLGPLFGLLPLPVRDHLPDQYLEALTP